MTVARFIDITRVIHPGMAVYPNNPAVEFSPLQAAGQGINALSRITLGSHTGTHLDAPSHIHPDGAGALIYPLEQMNGSCEVVDLSGLTQVISAADIGPTGADRVLFRTRNSNRDQNSFDEDFVALDDSAADILVSRGLKLVGLDALSIRKRGAKNRVHEKLIDAGIIILEGLWLRDVRAQRYELLCLPLKLDLDGAPVRAVLRPD